MTSNAPATQMRVIVPRRVTNAASGAAATGARNVMRQMTNSDNREQLAALLERLARRNQNHADGPERSCPTCKENAETRAVAAKLREMEPVMRVSMPGPRILHITLEAAKLADGEHDLYALPDVPRSRAATDAVDRDAVQRLRWNRERAMAETKAMTTPLALAELLEKAHGHTECEDCRSELAHTAAKLRENGEARASQCAKCGWTFGLTRPIKCGCGGECIPLYALDLEDAT